MMTIEQAAADIDAVIELARRKSLAFIAESERRFVDSVVGRGALSTEDALRVLDEERPGVLDSLDENMKELRAWILRGGTDAH